MKINAPQLTERDTALARMLWVLVVGLIYLFTWRASTHLSGKWPAPFWFSVSLGVYLIYGFSGRPLNQVGWMIPVSILGLFVAWFFTFELNLKIGSDKWLYQHLKWYYQNSWPEKIPVALFMASVMFALSKSKHRLVDCLIFAAILFAVLCGTWLAGVYMPIGGGGFDHVDHDIYGFRIGAYFLVATALSLSLANAFRFPFR